MNVTKKIFVMGMMIAVFSPVSSPGQQVRKNILHHGDVSQSTLAGMMGFRGIDRNFLDALSRHRLPAHIKAGMDSLHLKGPSHSSPVIKYLSDKNQGIGRSLKKSSVPATKISLVDTAIVIGYNGCAGTFDTIRHVYSYDGLGKMTLDLTQYPNSGEWVDGERWVGVYDIRGNMLSGVSEY